MVLPDSFNDALNDDEDDCKITINTQYAKKFQKFKECQELDKLKKKYGNEIADNDSSSSESEDDNAEALTPQIEQDFLQALSMIKQKDPKIYEKDTVFFKKDEDKVNDNKDKETKNTKPLYLKDYERQRLLEKGHKAYISDSDEDNDAPTVDSEISKLKVDGSSTYMEEQRLLKNNLVSAAKFGSADDDDDDDDDDLLQIRYSKSNDNDKSSETEKAEIKSKTTTLNRYWKNDQLDSGEKFLRDYILNKQFKDSASSRIPFYNEVVSDNKEEPSDEETNREEFERKFNFRYEEPDPEFIKRYPRTINESVRRKDDKRKQQRKLREERKEKEKEKKKDELKRLKNLKRKEIMEKIEKLKEITGNEKIGFLEDDIQDDFDMSKYDELMEKVFDDEYYNDETMGDEEKPVFPDDDEEDYERCEGYEENDGYDGYDGHGDESYIPHCEDPDFIMDADYVPNKNKKDKFSKKKGFNAKFAEAVNREKPLFDPKQQTFEEYFDEYYKLDFEDVIGDMPIRFKYREVVPNDFGLSTDEILKADDKELNEWCSLKRATQYLGNDEERKLQQKYKKKSRNKNKKIQVFSNLREELEKEEKLADNPNLEPIAKQNNSGSKKKFKLSSIDNKSRPKMKKKTLVPSWNVHNRRTIISSVNKTKIKNLRKNFKGGSDKLIKKLSLERLAAYGLDEKRKKTN